VSNHRRDSDRWITPRVVALALFLATILVLAVIAAVTYLTARGLNPDPMISLVAKVGAAIGTLGTLALQLSGRSTVAKIERNTGSTLPAKVEDIGAQVQQALWVDERSTTALPPVPPPVRNTERHPFSGAQT
jgi:hypothetical protein